MLQRKIKISAIVHINQNVVKTIKERILSTVFILSPFTNTMPTQMTWRWYTRN